MHLEATADPLKFGQPGPDCLVIDAGIRGHVHTTGVSKGVMLTHRNLVANALEAQGGAGQVDLDLFEDAGGTPGLPITDNSIDERAVAGDLQPAAADPVDAGLEVEVAAQDLLDPLDSLHVITHTLVEDDFAEKGLGELVDFESGFGFQGVLSPTLGDDADNVLYDT